MNILRPYEVKTLNRHKISALKLWQRRFTEVRGVPRTLLKRGLTFVHILEDLLLFTCVHSNWQKSMKIACGDGIFALWLSLSYGQCGKRADLPEQ